MREERREANSTSPLCQGNQLPWQYWSDACVPSFLQPLPKWKVVLCKTHENCFARDTLRDHLICHHGATSYEAVRFTSSSKMADVAESWKDAVHPGGQIGPIEPIPGLPIIRGYWCAVLFCMYCTLTRRDLRDHFDEEDHIEDKCDEEYECFLQTLSSRPGEAHYFRVSPPDEWRFPLYY